MTPGDIVTIAAPFGDGVTKHVVSGVVDTDTSVVWDGSSHSAYANYRLTFISAGGEFPSAPSDDDADLWRITKLAFKQRFTTAEKVGLEMAGIDNPAAPMEQRALAAGLRVNQADILAATYIDLKRADTRAGVMALEQYGLIAAGRALVILDTVPTEIERYVA